MAKANNNALSPQEARHRFREYQHNNPLRRGIVTRKTLHQDNPVAAMTALVILGGIIFTLLYGFFIMPEGKHVPIPFWMTELAKEMHEHPKILRWVASIAFGFQTSIFFMLLFWFWPMVGLICHALFKFKRPKITQLKRYSAERRTGAYFILAFLVTCFLHTGNGLAIWHVFAPTHLGAHFHDHPDAAGDFFLAWGLIWLFFALTIPRLLLKEHQTSTVGSLKKAVGIRTGDFSIYLGKSTGALTKRGHKAGIGSEQHINLSAQDAALNILILGGIGEGKTTGAINALLLQLLDQDCGGLIFDVKGSFHETVTQLAQITNTPVVTVGPGRQRINLLAKLKPEVAADIMGSVFLMTSENKGDAFWVTQATNLCRGALGLLSYTQANYTLEGLRRYIFDEAFREEIDVQLASQEDLSDRDRAMLESYRSSLAMFYACRDKMQEDIRSTASTALSLFTHPDIQESFCSHTDETLHLENVLDGTVFLVDMPKSEYGRASQVVHAVIKMRWFHVMEARRRHKEWNQDRMVFFMCDEYQSLITASPTEGSISDLSFWDKARDTKTIGIISAQSISSFYSTVGRRELADTVLQNFRQRLCFKTEDDKTIQHIQHIAGDVMVANHSESKHRGKSSGQGKSQHSRSSSQSLTHIRQHVVDSQLIRILEPNQVIALLNINQRSMDDVINLQPVFLNH